MDKHVQKPQAEPFICQISAPEQIQPVDHLIFGNGGFPKFFFCDQRFIFFHLIFQFHQPVLCRWRQNPVFDGRHNILKTLLCISQRGLIRSQTLFLIGFFGYSHNFVCNVIYHIVPEHILDRAADDIILQIILAISLQRTVGSTLSFLGGAFVVVVDLPAFAPAGFPYHERAAFPAEYPAGEKIAFRSFEGRRLPRPVLHPCMHRIPELLIDQGRNRNGNAVIGAFSDIFSVAEHRINSVFGNRFSFPILYAKLLQLCENIRRCFSGGRMLKNIAHDPGFFFLLLVMFILVDIISVWRLAGDGLSLQCGFSLATFYLLPQIFDIIFCQTFHQGFQYDPLRTVRDRFFCVEDPDTISLQPDLVQSDLLPITTEPVNFPDDYSLKLPLLRIGNHTVKLCPMGKVRSGDVLVRIDIKDSNIVFFRICHAVPDLSLNALIGLPGAGRVSGVNYSIHSVPPILKMGAKIARFH